jgi:OFA family oxalate/formate antiporter-like MFS transporter
LDGGDRTVAAGPHRSDRTPSAVRVPVSTTGSGSFIVDTEKARTMGDQQLPFSRWWLVAVAAGLMGATGTYQFVWSSIRVPLGGRVGGSETALGTVFTVFLVFQALSQFPAGWVRDRYGPRVPLLAAVPLLAVGYVWTGRADTLASVYVAYALGGVGVGVTYTVAVNTAVKWFTDRRGLATGLVTMSYAGVSFLVIPAVRRGVRESFETTLAGLGAALAALALVGAVVLRDPPGVTDHRDAVTTERAPDADPSDPPSTERRDRPVYGWREAVRTWQFWLLYGVFVVVNGVGLMLIGKVVAYAEAFGLSAATATAGASAIAVGEMVGIALIGGLSDRFGRERTVAVSLVVTGVVLGGTVPLGATGVAWAFVALVGVAALFRAPAFSVFPSLVGEYYGPAHSSENYALVYTAKVWGSILGGTVASGLVVSLGWTTSFLLAAAAISLAGVATAFLRPPA